MRAHVMDGNLIVNTIIVESIDFLPNLKDADLYGGGPGDSIIDDVLIPYVAPVAVPESVDRLQARLALLSIDKWHLIQPVIDGFDEPTKSIAQAYFEDANQWYRHDQFVLMIAPLIGLDAAALDAVFISAGQF